MTAYANSANPATHAMDINTARGDTSCFCGGFALVMKVFGVRHWVFGVGCWGLAEKESRCANFDRVTCWLFSHAPTPNAQRRTPNLLNRYFLTRLGRSVNCVHD